MKPRLPRLRAGEVLTATAWNDLCDAIDACYVSVHGGVLQANHTPVGVDIFLPPFVDIFPAKSTSAITKATTTDYGKGTFKRRTFGDASSTAIMETVEEETCYSVWTDKQVTSSGTGLLVGRGADGKYWLLDADACTGLS